MLMLRSFLFWSCHNCWSICLKTLACIFWTILNKTFKILMSWTGELARWLRVLAVHTENPGLVPEPTWQLTTTLTPVPETQRLSSNLLQHQMCTWYTYMHVCMQNTHTHKKIKTLCLLGFYFKKPLQCHLFKKMMGECLLTTLGREAPHSVCVWGRVWNHAP